MTTLQGNSISILYRGLAVQEVCFKSETRCFTSANNQVVPTKIFRVRSVTRSVNSLDRSVTENSWIPWTRGGSPRWFVRTAAWRGIISSARTSVRRVASRRVPSAKPRLMHSKFSYFRDKGAHVHAIFPRCYGRWRFIDTPRPSPPHAAIIIRTSVNLNVIPGPARRRALS